jgi:hypothetical protein
VLSEFKELPPDKASRAITGIIGLGQAANRCATRSKKILDIP